MPVSNVLRRLFVLVLLATLVAAATGCSRKSPTSPDVQPTRVLVLEDGGTQDSVRVILEAAGYDVTMAGPFWQYRGAGLADHDVVLFLCGVAYTQIMPDSVERKLVDFVVNGGGLMTTEWLQYRARTGVYYPRLRPILPSVYGGGYASGPDTCRVNGVHPIAIGLPAMFVTRQDWTGSILALDNDPAKQAQAPISGSYTGNAVVTGVYGTGRIVSWSMAGHYDGTDIWSPEAKTLLRNITAWLGRER
jgi:hypothetical protein